MLIGIDASRAFLKRRTGIEEYAYQTIKYLRSVIPETDTVVLYMRKKMVWQDGGIHCVLPDITFDLPQNWRVRGIWAPRFWTQIGLSFEMFFRAPEVLFIPAHTVPIIHPKNTIVTIHGLEYEFCKEGYSVWERLYMRFSIRYSCRVARTLVCVSENTKRDVMNLYQIGEEKIRVVYEGYGNKAQSSNIKNQTKPKAQITNPKPYLLFIGRLEERKNIVRIIEAFEILKEQYALPHQLVLVGKPGYGYDRIECKIAQSKQKNHIQEVGYVSEEEKWGLLRGADVFLFPSLYEGFGIPVLEAQSVGVPVVASNSSSLPEVGGEGAVYVNPLSVESIVQGVYGLISTSRLRDDIIEKARHNVRGFSWEDCAQKIYQLFSRE